MPRVPGLLKPVLLMAIWMPFWKVEMPLICQPPITKSAALGRKLPEDWENRNVHLVLLARVISNTPAQPEMVASHVW